MGSAREPDPPWYMLAQPTLHKVQQKPVFKLCRELLFFQHLFTSHPAAKGGEEGAQGRQTPGLTRVPQAREQTRREHLSQGFFATWKNNFFFRAMLFLRAKGDVVLISINYVRLVCSASDDQNWRGL